MKKYTKYSLLLVLLIIISLIAFWFYNPSIANEDFDLEFKVSNEGKDFYNERNKKIEIGKFKYSDERYFNDVDKYDLIIHSLDIIEGKERIIIVYNPQDTNINFKTANITYREKAGDYPGIKIEHKNDSIFIIQQIGVENNLMYKGKRSKV